jgi:hypothetical protein
MHAAHSLCVHDFQQSSKTQLLHLPSRFLPRRRKITCFWLTIYKECVSCTWSFTNLSTKTSHHHCRAPRSTMRYTSVQTASARNFCNMLPLAGNLFKQSTVVAFNPPSYAIASSFSTSSFHARSTREADLLSKRVTQYFLSKQNIKMKYPGSLNLCHTVLQASLNMSAWNELH